MQKMTLWERLTTKKEPIEFSYYNPLKARIGSIVDIDLADYHDKSFVVMEIRELNRTINGQKFQTVDYLIEGKKLRVNPLLTPVNGLSFNTLLLDLYDDLTYDEGLHNVCKTSLKLEVTDNDIISDFFRIGDNSHTQEATVNVIHGGEVVSQEINFWDFSRIVKDAAEQEYEEFVFVEMSTDSGRFNLWRGREIDPHRVSLI